jgi:hypothetical protein
MTNQRDDALTRRRFLHRAYWISATSLIALTGTGQLSSGHDTTASAANASSQSISGIVTDRAELTPIAGVRVRLEPAGFESRTDLAGKYTLIVPPGNYSIQYAASGFITATYRNQIVSDGPLTLDVSLLPSTSTPDQQRRLYERSVKQSFSPLVDSATMSSLASLGPLTSLPSVIDVFYDGAPGSTPPCTPPCTISVPLEDYVKGVVPNEVPASWPTSTLQAQAVAARSYGVASQLSRGFVYPDTRSQVYDPSRQDATTNAAVDATAGVVMTVSGAIVYAYFFSECNGTTTRNSENLNLYRTDQNGYIIYNSQGQAECTNCVPGVSCWNYVSYCRARPCTGHPPSTFSDCGYYGHGVGMCQWGAYYRGNLVYWDILNSFYTGVTISAISSAPTSTPVPTATPSPTPSPTRTPTPTATPIPTPRALGPFLVLMGQAVTINWQGVGSGFTYVVTLSKNGNTLRWTTGETSQYVGVLDPGTWTWSIQASNNTSATATLEVVAKIYSQDLPLVRE